MAHTWQTWTPVSEGSSTPGAPVAAVPWEDSFALFISDPSGGIYAIKATPGYGWELVPGHSTKPGAPITALLSGNLFTLFMADVNGEIFTTSGAPYQGWQTWTPVSEGSSTPGAPVAAVPWEDSFALFISDPSGGIYAIKATPGYGWELVPGQNTKPGAQVTAVPWQDLVSPGRFLLFMVDASGGISMTSGNPYQSWDIWTSPPGGSTPGAPVTAVPGPANEPNLALFVANSSGEVYTTSSPTPPPAPTGLQLISLSALSGASNTDVKLGWTAVPAPGGANDIVYQLTFSDGASSGSTISNTNDAQLNLTAGSTYTFYVQASYSDSTIGVPNALSAPSNSIMVSTPPQRTVIAKNVTGSTGGSPSEITVTVQGSGFAPNSVVVVHITPTNRTTAIQLPTTVGADGTFENSIAIQCIVGIGLAVTATVDNDPTYVLGVPPNLTC
jgi:hypothetical protein